LKASENDLLEEVGNSTILPTAVKLFSHTVYLNCTSGNKSSEY